MIRTGARKGEINLVGGRNHKIPRAASCTPYGLTDEKRSNMRVFINYKQNVEPDHSLAKALELRLRKEGHRVFRDESMLKSGEEWPARLEKEVRHCQGMISLISNESLRSTWVRNEIELAKKLGKRMFPFLLEEIDESARFQYLNPNFMSTHWITLSGDMEEKLKIITAALTEPRHKCYRDLIDAKLSEHGVNNGNEILEALCGLLWQAHWPAEILGYAENIRDSRRLNDEPARTIAEALRNQAESLANVNDNNASAYLKINEPDIASRLMWQVQRLKCAADLINSLIVKWNESCQKARKRMQDKKVDKCPVFDASDGERAFAPLDEYSKRARFSPSPKGVIVSMRIPPELQGLKQLPGAVRLCEYLDDGTE